MQIYQPQTLFCIYNFKSMLQNNNEEYQIMTKLVPKAQQKFQQWAEYTWKQLERQKLQFNNGWKF